LFGRPKPKTSSAPKATDAIAKLNETMEMMDKRIQHLQKQIDKSHQDAKDATRRKDKRGAMYHLKRKMALTKQLDNTYNNKLNMDTQILALQNASWNNEMLEAQKVSNAALKAVANDKMIEEAQDVRESLEEGMQMAEELGQAVSQPIGPTIDEDEMDAELAALAEEVADEDILALDNGPVRSTVQPTPTISAKTPLVATPAPAAAPKASGKETLAEKEARELRELEEEMALA